MGVPDNLQANSSKVAYTTYWPIDQVIYSNTYNLTINNTVSSSPQTFFYSLPTEIPNGSNWELPIGIFSTDGGTTWNDAGNVPSSSSLTNGLTLPAVTVGLYMDRFPGPNYTLNIQVTVSSTIGGGSTFPLIVSVAILAPSSPTSLSALPTLSSTTNKTAATTITPSGLPAAYRRIINSNLFTTAIGTNITSVAHGLSYVPDAIVWLNDNLGNGYTGAYLRGFEAFIDSKATGLPQINAGNGNPLFFMDSTNIYYAQWGQTSSYINRLYKP